MPTDHINNRRRGLTTPQTKSNVEIKSMKTDTRLHYIFYHGIGVGVLFKGNEKQCRNYLLNTPDFQKNSTIVTEDECNKLRNMNSSQIHSYFLALETESMK